MPLFLCQHFLLSLSLPLSLPLSVYECVLFWWRAVLCVVSIYSAPIAGIPDFEVWVSCCVKCPHARHQPGIVLCLNSTGLPKKSKQRRLDCRNITTGRCVTLVAQEKDQQTSMSFSELEVVGIDATGLTCTPTHTHKDRQIGTHTPTNARARAHTHTHTRAPLTHTETRIPTHTHKCTHT